jgi:aminoglycoside phosphotransferase (APT) family kinase protein
MIVAGAAPSSAPAATRLQSLSMWHGVPVIAPIEGGRTNENFCVTVGSRRFFARIGVDLPHHGISRANEVACHRRAAAAGIAPAVLHAADGIMVTEFLTGRTLVQGAPVEDTTLVNLAAVLRRLADHADPAGLPPFDPVSICRRDLASVPPTAIAEEKRWRAAAILSVAPALGADALIHADLIPENVIVDGERVMLVDWEYAGRGDPAVDAAAVILHFGLDARQAALLVAAHGGVDARKVAALQPVLALREALWCEVQKHQVGVRGDLAAYTEMCWQRLDRIAT